MIEFPFVCTACDFSAPSAAELAEHLRKTHEPIPVEAFTEFLRRGASAEAELAAVGARLAGIHSSDIAAGEEVCVRLHRLRQAAAAAIASSRRPALLEIAAELDGLHVAAAADRDESARIAKSALESSELVRRVLEMLPEAPA